MIRPHFLQAACLALLLAACGGDGGTETPNPPGNQEGVLVVAAPGDLASWARGRLQALDAQSRMVGGVPSGPGTPVAMPGAGAAALTTSHTLVQEDGVDEADLLLATGSKLHALLRGAGNGDLRLLVQTLADDGTLGAAQRLTLPGVPEGGTQQPEGLMSLGEGKALVAVSRRWEPVAGEAVCADCAASAPVWLKSAVQVHRLDTLDASRPVPGAWLVIEGSLVEARRIGDMLVIVAVHRPVLSAQTLPTSATRAQRASAIAGVTSAQLLPTLRRNGGAPEPLLGDTDCWLQPDSSSLTVQLTTVTLVNLAEPQLPQTSRCFAGSTDAVYLTPQNLWLATSLIGPLAEGTSNAAVPPRTVVYQFALDPSAAGGVVWRGSASVEGHLGWDRERTSYRLSEHDGHLRVLTYTGNTGWATLEDASAKAASPARLTVLRAASASSSAPLAQVGVLPNDQRPAAIGKPGEQVYAVRFVGQRGYVVTFRQVDPLYVIDLADPTDPRLAGEVELPGYSQVLMPLGNDLLLGLGREADAAGVLRGLQLTLFDVADAAAPSVLRTLTLGQAGSASALEYARHGLAMRLDGSTARLALPVQLAGTPWGDYQRGLQTFTVNTAARTMALRSLHGAVDGSASPGWLGDERAVLVGERVVHLRAGDLASYGW
jgi:hypothetical protein